MRILKRHNRRSPIDLVHQHATCEMNFHQLMDLLPGLRDGVLHWQFNVGYAPSDLNVSIKSIEQAPYTTTLTVEQKHHHLPTPKIVVRLYHDVEMAEIIAWDNHRHWRPQYNYPNRKMYHPDEKQALNEFLADWLSFCRKLGLQSDRNVIQFT